MLYTWVCVSPLFGDSLDILDDCLDTKFGTRTLNRFTKVFLGLALLLVVELELVCDKIDLLILLISSFSWSLSMKFFLSSYYCFFFIN